MCLLHLHRQSSSIICIYSHIHHTPLFTFACIYITQSCPHFFKTGFHSNCGNQSNRHPRPPARPASTYHPGPPHASHVPLRQGARHWAPPPLSSLHPHRPRPPPPPVFAHAPQFHPSYLPPGLHHVLTKAANPKKRKGKIKKKGENNTAATMQNSAGPSTVFCPGPCLSSPGLPCKHTLSSEGTTACRLGGWNRGVVLSKAV